MNYLVISDIHGNDKYLSNLDNIIKEEKINKIIILGDILSGGPNPLSVAYILNKYKDMIYAVKGNNDTYYDEEELDFKLVQNLSLIISKKVFYFTHGHIFNETNIPSDIHIDVLMHGHTHVGFIHSLSNNLIVANPGSISYPRYASYISYIIINDEYITLKNIDGSIINQKKYI